MKADILNIIKHPSLSNSDKFNLLFDFYKKNQSKDRNLESNFNKIGCTPHQFSKLIYEVKKVYKISDLETVQHIYTSPETITKSIDENIIDSSEFVGKDENILKTYNPELNQTENLENTNNDLPIRVEFPFLNSEECPEEFKILINDKITAYNKIVAGRGALDDPNTPEEQRAEIAKSITDADILNSLIYDELKHYQETGKILGNHQIFSTHNLKKSIENMTAEQKVQRKESLKGQIRVAKGYKTKSENKGDFDKAESLKNKIEKLELEGNLIIKSLEKTNN